MDILKEWPKTDERRLTKEVNKWIENNIDDNIDPDCGLGNYNDFMYFKHTNGKYFYIEYNDLPNGYASCKVIVIDDLGRLKPYVRETRGYSLGCSNGRKY